MGGQACVFYGAAQVSKDVDLFLLASAGNYQRLEQSLHALNARRIAVRLSTRRSWPAVMLCISDARQRESKTFGFTL